MAKKDDNFDFDIESKAKLSLDFSFLKNLTQKQKETILMVAIGVVVLIVIIVIGVLLLGGNGTNNGGIGGNNGGSNIDLGNKDGVDPDEITSMNISALPIKTVYYVGEGIDLKGLTVQIKTNNGGTISEYYEDHVEDFVVIGFDSSVPVEKQKVFVEYKGYKVFFNVKIEEMPIAAPILQGIYINPLPKTTYKVGGTFIALSAKIVATFSDGSTQTIPLQKSHLSGWAEAIQTPGEHEIKVVYFDGNGGYAETTFTITVTE